MFREAQKNIMELNNQRLKAMEELKVARYDNKPLPFPLSKYRASRTGASGPPNENPAPRSRPVHPPQAPRTEPHNCPLPTPPSPPLILPRGRIQDLEKQMDEMRAINSSVMVQMQQLQRDKEAAESALVSAGRSVPASVAPAPAAAPAPAPVAAAAAPPAPAQGKPAAPATTITILYETGWNRAFLHYNGDRKGWTQVPGLLMDRMEGPARAVTVTAQAMEFVLTNGDGKWDSPDGGNYVITSPGRYSLTKGKINKV